MFEAWVLRLIQVGILRLLGEVNRGLDPYRCPHIRGAVDNRLTTDPLDSFGNAQEAKVALRGTCAGTHHESLAVVLYQHNDIPWTIIELDFSGRGPGVFDYVGQRLLGDSFSFGWKKASNPCSVVRSTASPTVAER